MPSIYTKPQALRKNNSLLKLGNDMLIDLPSPANISYFWNFGSLLGVCLVIQIITGIALAMHYTPHVDSAFSSVVHIMVDVNYGWALRYIHANGASVFFIMVYIHISRGLYYGSYSSPRQALWIVGVLLFFLMMATAFLGYILPWGQMSFWGATVITNLISAIPYIGESVVYWLWGGFSVDNATLNRFFSLHYLLPFILVALVLVHLILLHEHGSNNPLGIPSSVDKIPFHPYYTVKDILGVVSLLILFATLLYNLPNLLGHPDNYIAANPLSTPAHIVPEWYFLFAYAILRSIPNKLGGVLALFASILILVAVPFLHFSPIRSMAFRPIGKILYWIFIINFFFLTWIGGNPVEDPYVTMGQISTLIYFGYFFTLPLVAIIETSLLTHKT